MKLIQPQLVNTEPARGRQKTDAMKHVAAVESVERVRSSSSYTSSYSAQSRLPGKFMEQNHQAINSYLDTAAMDADGGELIGIDTYA